MNLLEEDSATLTRLDWDSISVTLSLEIDMMLLESLFRKKVFLTSPSGSVVRATPHTERGRRSGGRILGSIHIG